MSTFGHHLLAWRRARGLTQKALAREAGLPQPNLCAMECDRQDPTLSTLRRLAAALGIRPGELVDHLPSSPTLDRQAIDRVVRRALSGKPLPAASKKLASREMAIAGALRRIVKERLAAAGKGSGPRRGAGERTLRQLKAELGESTWQAVLERMEKFL